MQFRVVMTREVCTVGPAVVVREVVVDPRRRRMFGSTTRVALHPATCPAVVPLAVDGPR